MTATRVFRGIRQEIERRKQERNIVEIDHFGELVRGDVTGITGEAGSFEFLSARLDEDGEVMWISVYGGPRGREMMRSFAPDRVTKKISKRGKRAAVAEEDRAFIEEEDE